MGLFKSKEFVVFLFAGGFAALVNFGSRFFYNEFVSYGNAVILAYITGMITAFILTKFFVFRKSKNSTNKELFYFTLVNIVAIIQTYIISVGFSQYLFPNMGFEFYPEAVAHALGVIFPVFTSFIGHKYFSFRNN
jgi:putative flippase GtrA